MFKIDEQLSSGKAGFALAKTEQKLSISRDKMLMKYQCYT